VCVCVCVPLITFEPFLWIFMKFSRKVMPLKMTSTPHFLIS
jgi:hypothetical protein